MHSCTGWHCGPAITRVGVGYGGSRAQQKYKGRASPAEGVWRLTAGSLSGSRCPPCWRRAMTRTRPHDRTESKTRRPKRAARSGGRGVKRKRPFCTSVFGFGWDVWARRLCIRVGPLGCGGGGRVSICLRGAAETWTCSLGPSRGAARWVVTVPSPSDKGAALGSPCPSPWNRAAPVCTGRTESAGENREPGMKAGDRGRE